MINQIDFAPYCDSLSLSEACWLTRFGKLAKNKKEKLLANVFQFVTRFSTSNVDERREIAEMFIYIFWIERGASEEKQKLKEKENFAHEKVFMTQLLTEFLPLGATQLMRKRVVNFIVWGRRTKNNCLSLLLLARICLLPFMLFFWKLFVGRSLKGEGVGWREAQLI